jgi:hypothetical protein
MSSAIAEAVLSRAGGEQGSAIDQTAGGPNDGRTIDDPPSFGFDRVTNTFTLNLGAAQLHFRCVDGAIEIASDAPIRIRSGREAELAGAGEAILSSGQSSIAVTPESTRVRADDLHVSAVRTDFAGKSLHARADHVKVVWGRCERVVGRAFDYARHAYARVEVLLHTRAGRIRTETDGAHLIQAGTARIHAKGDVRVQGTSINLG